MLPALYDLEKTADGLLFTRMDQADS